MDCSRAAPHWQNGPSSRRRRARGRRRGACRVGCGRETLNLVWVRCITGSGRRRAPPGCPGRSELCAVVGQLVTLHVRGVYRSASGRRRRQRAHSELRCAHCRMLSLICKNCAAPDMGRVNICVHASGTGAPMFAARGCEVIGESDVDPDREFAVGRRGTRSWPTRMTVGRHYYLYMHPVSPLEICLVLFSLVC